VAAIEEVNGKECYRIEISPAGKDKARQGPMTKFWADKDTLNLRKLETQRRVRGKLRTLSQSYEPTGAKSVAVMGLSNAIPIDIPSFSSERLRGPSTYKSFSGDGRKRGPGGAVGFVTEVKQEITPADPNRVNNLLGMRPRGGSGMVEVRLKTPGRQVDQVWMQGSPWPSYSDNGTTVARLVQ
jgi:hypothetical protein